MKQVRVYVEGGGDQRSGKAAVQEGFSKFLRPLREKARENRIRWDVIACGSRNSAFDNFKIALCLHPNAFNVLLVDAEGPVSQPPWTHLQQSDGWSKLDISDDNCHLMVQVMEAGFIADLGTLATFYGQGFNLNPIPKQFDVEWVGKPDLEAAIKIATQNTSKGEYHQIRHGPKILALLDVDKVRSRAQHCERMFAILLKKLTEA